MDLTQKRARHRRFWQPLTKGEGGYLAVVSPIDDDGGMARRRLAPPVSLEEQWLSVEYNVDRTEAEAQNIFYGQDAVHRASVNFGPGVHAAMLGAPYVLKKDTVWFDTDPPIKSWDPEPCFVTNRGHDLYKAVEAHTRALCEASKGRYAVPFTDIGGQMDVLFSLRGEELLTDLIEYPAEVLAAEEKLDREFIDYFKTLRDIIGPTGCGYTSWIPVVCDDPWYPLQCDMSVMISAGMFERFVLPSLDKVSTAIGQSVYHLDGPGEIQHLDMLLSLKHVHAIQWVPLPTAKDSAGGPGYKSYADTMSLNMYHRVLAAKKKLVLLDVRPHEIPAIFSEVGCDGVFIQTNCGTRREADELIELAHKNWIKT